MWNLAFFVLFGRAGLAVRCYAHRTTIAAALHSALPAVQPPALLQNCCQFTHLLLLLLLRRLLLGCECCYLTDVVKPRLEVLTAGLPGADIAAMVQEDPRLLFEELESSELWQLKL